MPRSVSCYEDVAPMSSTLPTEDQYAPSVLTRTISEDMDELVGECPPSAVYGRSFSCAPAPVKKDTKKRPRTDLLSSTDENISKELAGGEAGLSSTDDEETEDDPTKPRGILSPRCLFPAPAAELEEGELPPVVDPKAIYDTSNLIGKAAGCVFTNEEAASSCSQLY